MEDRGAWPAAVHGVTKDGLGTVPLSNAKFGGYRDEKDMPYHEATCKGRGRQVSEKRQRQSERDI